jgi:serine protease Do
VILALDGKDVQDANDLLNRVAQAKPGTTVALTVWRDGRRRDIKARVSAREEEKLAGKPPAEPKPEEAGMTSLGIEAADLGEEERRVLQIGPEIKGGVVVTAVNPAGAAAEAEIREGDVILEANRKPVDSVGELRDALSRTPKRKSILLLLYRQGSTFFTLVTPR